MAKAETATPPRFFRKLPALLTFKLSETWTGTGVKDTEGAGNTDVVTEATPTCSTHDATTTPPLAVEVGSAQLIPTLVAPTTPMTWKSVAPSTRVAGTQAVSREVSHDEKAKGCT